MIPGSNLLSQALTLIASQSITYYAWVSRATNAVGIFVNTYASPVTINGSVQPIGPGLVQSLGLDLQRQYVNIFVPQAVVDIYRDVSSDQFQYGGNYYQAISVTKWNLVDGWVECLAVQVPNAG